MLISQPLKRGYFGPEVIQLHSLGDSNKQQIYGTFEGFPLIMMHEVRVGVIYDPCFWFPGPFTLSRFCWTWAGADVGHSVKLNFLQI